MIIIITMLLWAVWITFFSFSKCGLELYVRLLENIQTVFRWQLFWHLWLFSLHLPSQHVLFFFFFTIVLIPTLIIIVDKSLGTRLKSRTAPGRSCIKPVSWLLRQRARYIFDQACPGTLVRGWTIIVSLREDMRNNKHFHVPPITQVPINIG